MMFDGIIRKNPYEHWEFPYRSLDGQLGWRGSRPVDLDAREQREQTALESRWAQGDEPRFTAYNLNKLAVVSAAGDPPRVLTAALDRAVQEPLVWSADGKQIWFVVQDDRITSSAAGATVAF